MRGCVAIGVSLLLAGCAGVSVVPPDLKEKVDWNVSFQQVKTTPLSYQGKFIVVGGGGAIGETAQTEGHPDRNPAIATG